MAPKNSYYQQIVPLWPLTQSVEQRWSNSKVVLSILSLVRVFFFPSMCGLDQVSRSYNYWATYIIIISAVAPPQSGHLYTEFWIDLEFGDFNLLLADLLKSSAWAKWLILIDTGKFYVCANRMSRAMLPTWSVSTPCPRQWCIIRFTNSSKQLIRFTTSARKRPSLISCKMLSFLLNRYVVRAVETVSWTLDSKGPHIRWQFWFYQASG